MAILLLASVLRFYKLADVPSGFFCDEAVQANQAYSLSQTGRDLYGEPWPILINCYHKFFQEGLNEYVMALVFRFREMDIFGARSVSALAGVLSALGAYLIVRQLWGWAPALAAAGLVAVSPWQLPLSRVAFHGTMVCAVLTFALYFFYVGLKRPGFLVFCAAMMGLGPHTYSILKLFVPLLALALFIFYRRELLSVWQDRWGRGCIYASVFVFVLLAWPMYFLSVWGPGNLRFKEISILSQDYPGLSFWRAFQLHISPDFLFISGDSNPRHHSGFGGQIFWALLPVLIFSVFEALRRKNREGILFSVLFFEGFIPVCMTMAEIEGIALRSISAAPFVELVAAYGFLRLYEILRERKIFPHPWFVGLGVLIGINAAALVGHYFTVYPTKSQEFFQYGVGEAVEYGRTHQEEYDRIYLTHEAWEGDTLLVFFTKVNPADYQKTRSKGKFFYCTPDTAACLAQPGKNLYILTPREAFPDRIKEYQGHKVMVLEPGDLEADHIKHLVLDARKALSFVVCEKPKEGTTDPIL